MIELTQRDSIRYEKLKKEALSSPLLFRRAAREANNQYLIPYRRLISPIDNDIASAYNLLDKWSVDVAPELENLLDKTARRTGLHTSLAKHLNLLRPDAEARADQLLEARAYEIVEIFIQRECPSVTSRQCKTVRELLHRPASEVHEIHRRFTEYILHQSVADELEMAIYDSHATSLSRRLLAMRERRQVARYKKSRTKQLQQALDRQDELKTENKSLLGRIVALGIDTVVVIDAYRQYKKRLDTLKPTSNTPAKRLTIFSEVTEPIREIHVNKLTTFDKLVDLQNALKEVDNVLVEIFDMNSTERNALLSRLKEYRDLMREVVSITAEENL